MSLELAPYIERLLYTNDTVVLPGLGAFVSQPAPAGVDYAGGTISPPAKTLTFNDNLTTDDGLLTYELVQEKGISDEEAQAWVEERIAAMMVQLNQREIIALPNIGRLYKNYVQKIQFLPDATNFSRENFGLPPLQFSPLSRSREVTEDATIAPPPVSTPAAAAATTVAQAPQQQPTPSVYTPSTPQAFDTPPDGAQQWKRGVAIFALLILSGAVGYYFLKMQRERIQANKATTETIATEPDTPKNEDLSVLSETTPPPAAAKPAPEKVEKAPVETVKPKNKTCILVVGLFKDPDNITRLKGLLQKNGFTVYSVETANGAQSIGVQFKYSDSAEIQSNLAKLQQVTGEKNIRVKQK